MIIIKHIVFFLLFVCLFSSNQLERVSVFCRRSVEEKEMRNGRKRKYRGGEENVKRTVHRHKQALQHLPRVDECVWWFFFSIKSMSAGMLSVMRLNMCSAVCYRVTPSLLAELFHLGACQKKNTPKEQRVRENMSQGSTVKHKLPSLRFGIVGMGRSRIHTNLESVEYTACQRNRRWW